MAATENATEHRSIWSDETVQSQTTPQSIRNYFSIISERKASDGMAEFKFADRCVTTPPRGLTDYSYWGFPFGLCARKALCYRLATAFLRDCLRPRLGWRQLAWLRPAAWCR